MSGLPSSLKQMAPYMSRSNEVAKVQPVVAYYCRYYAMSIGVRLMTLGQVDEEGKSYLKDLMEIIESERERLRIPDAEEGKLILEGFAFKIFKTADDADRAGKATAGTAQAFYAASIFLESLSQFGELSVDVQDRIKYAQFKAVDIKKALASGRKPVAGPPAGKGIPSQTEEEFSPPPPAVSTSYEDLSPPPPAYHEVPKPSTSRPAGAYPYTTKPPAPSVSTNLSPGQASESLPTPSGRSKLTQNDYKQAEKLCRYALQFADVGTAIMNLEQALKVLNMA